MSTSFNVRSMAAQAGIQTTGGFAVIAECVTLEELERFFQAAYAAGAAAEREACAKVADSISEDQWALYKGRPPYTGHELERASDYTQGKSDGAEVCAAAIRARGETK